MKKEQTPYKKHGKLLKSIERELGKETAVILHYLFSDQILWIPSKKSLKITKRNTEILQKWRSGTSVAALSKEYSLSKFWVRQIIKSRVNHCIYMMSEV